jgi:hypothetical protein
MSGRSRKTVAKREIKVSSVKPSSDLDDTTDYNLIIKTYVQHKVKFEDIKKLMNIIIKYILSLAEVSITCIKIDSRLKSLLRLINKALFEKDIINVKDIIGSRCLLKCSNHLDFKVFYENLKTNINDYCNNLGTICSMTCTIKDYRSDYFITQWSTSGIRFEIQFAVRKIEHFRYEVQRLMEVKTEEQLVMQKFIIEEMLEGKEELIKQMFSKILKINDIETFNNVLNEMKNRLDEHRSGFINFDFIESNDQQITLRNQLLSSFDT